MADDFKSLLDEQKKSNEILTGMRQDQVEQGSAKEIIKQSLPEVLNERQLHKQRMKFEKKEGKTEVDDKVEKQTKTIEKTAKTQEITFGAYQKEINDFVKNNYKRMDGIIYAAQSASKVDKDVRKSAQKQLEGYFKKSNQGEKIQIDIAQESLDTRKKEIEKQGGVAEKDAQYKIDMLALERRKARLERRNATGLAGRTAAEFKNRARMLKELINIGSISRGIFSGIKGLTKGLFSGAGKVVGAGFGALKKFALLAFLPAILAFLNSEFWEKTKVFIADTLIPAVFDLYEKYLKPFGIFIGEKLLDAWKVIQEWTPTIITGLTFIYEKVLKPLGSALLTGFRFVFGLIGDLFFGREVTNPDSSTTRTGSGLFGIIGKLITGFKTGAIQDKFKSMLDSITGFFNYIFSSDSLADVYDATIGKIPGFSKNPFRQFPDARIDGVQGIPGVNMQSFSGADRFDFAPLQTVLDYGIGGKFDELGSFALQKSLNENLAKEKGEKLFKDLNLSVPFPGQTEADKIGRPTAIRKIMMDALNSNINALDPRVKFAMDKLTNEGRIIPLSSLGMKDGQVVINNAPMNTVNTQSNTQVQSASLVPSNSYYNMVSDYR